MKSEQREKWLKKFVEGYMFRDIQVCLEGYANFAAALALSVYTDVLGGLINGNLTAKGESEANYSTFLGRMGYEPKKCEQYYRDIRCGLAHQYFIKGESTVARVALEKTKGIHERDGITYFFADTYFEEFKEAYFIYKSELRSDTSLQAMFDKALSDEIIPYQARKYFDPSTTPLSYEVGAISPVSGSVVIFMPKMGPMPATESSQGEQTLA
ncbi:MAG: hypothetical protein ABSB26_03625 [Nitrososphaerales archaeon]|jgi:hypothetical protein